MSRRYSKLIRMQRKSKLFSIWEKFLPIQTAVYHIITFHDQLYSYNEKRKREKHERPIKAHFNKVSHGSHFARNSCINEMESNSTEYNA